VLAQFFDQQGKAQWVAPVWAAQSSGEQNAPRLLLEANNAGSFALHLAWLDRRFNVANVFVQKLSADGAMLWGAAGVAAGPAPDEQKEIQLLREGSNGLFVVWEDARNDKGDLFAQRFDSEGKTLWPAPGLALAQAEQGQFRPRVSSDQQNGFFAAWEDERGSGTNIYAQRMNALGQAQWPAAGVVLTDHGKKNSQPGVLAISPRRAWLAWMDERNGSVDIFAQALAAAGKFENVPPRFLSQPTLQAHAGSPYAYAIDAVDYDSEEAPALQLVRAPAWLQLHQTARKLEGTPANNDIGAAFVELHAVDNEGGRATQSFELKIEADSAVPRITSQPDTLATEDERYVYKITAVDPNPQETLRYGLESNASWLALSAQGELAGTPLNEHVGSYAVKIIVTNSKGKSAQQQFALRVENVNDAPFFTSTPDTIALVDSLYVYKPLAQDVDAGDRVVVTVLAAPAWLAWEPATQTLRGAPKFTDAGVTQIRLRAEDLSKAAAVQDWSVRVIDPGASDHTAPSSPQNLTITPARWSSTPQFTLRWQNPFDPSRIAGAYYKIGAAPNSARDGVLVRSSGSEPVREVQVQASSEGIAPVYVWLIDGRDNVDHKTAARVDYHYDRTAPQALSDLRVVTNNAGAWVASDTINFAWQPATDALSGVAAYTFNIDEKVVGQVASNVSKFVFILELKEGVHTCQVTAVDSAGNRRSSPRTNFGIDRTPPSLTHLAADTITLGQTLLLRARANDAASGVASVRVRYRNAGEPSFKERAMSLESDEFVASIDAAELHAKGFEYVISASDSAGNVARSIAPPRALHSVVVRSEQIAAPSATRGEYYQLVSLPYFIKPDSTLVWLQDDFGPYDQTEWRLYSYHPGRGNLEFGQTGFMNFAPGRGLWLITAERKSFDLGPAHSISTAQDFVLELQPGWNLIATPFDFPTDWTATQKSSLVESQLWSFDGKQYLANNKVVQPWQGYFVRNLNSVAEKISIPPIVAQASLPAFAKATKDFANDDTPLDPPSRGELARTPPHHFPLEGGQGGVTAQHGPLQWRIQLRVANNEFSDHENWLGVSSLAQEEWDELEWSEPPLAPGNFVALRFNQTTWQRFNGAFATDFRPPALHAQRWRFEILSALAGQRVSLTFARYGAAAQDQLFILQDEESRLDREIKFDGRSNVSTPITFRSTATPHRFVLWVGTKEQLAQQGVRAALTPRQFELAPVYPNPSRVQTGQEAMSTFRFSLPVPGAVDLRVYDMLGRQVRDLARKQVYVAGHHEIIWDGKDDDGNAVATGAYWYRMTVPSFHAARKMMVLKE
jgi:hypothetical protein